MMLERRSFRRTTNHFQTTNGIRQGFLFVTHLISKYSKQIRSEMVAKMQKHGKNGGRKKSNNVKMNMIRGEYLEVGTYETCNLVLVDSKIKICDNNAANPALRSEIAKTNSQKELTKAEQ